MLPLLNAEANPTPTPAPLGKVELDLEGAPFLEPEAPPEPGPATETAPAASRQAKVVEEPAKKSKKRFVIFGLIFVILLLGGLAAAYFMVFKGIRFSDDSVEVVVVPSTPPELPKAPVSTFNISWPPFWVEVHDPEGEIRFVYCKFMLVTDNQRVAMQVTNKNATLRDAVYYYLRNKPYTFLADLKQLDVVKAEVLNIINYYILPEQVLSTAPGAPQPQPGTPPRMEKVSEVLIEDYLIK